MTRRTRITSTLAALRPLESVGRGGMGEVWRAEYGADRRLVAVKYLTGSHAQNYDRLLREARAIARLRHPNILGVLDIGRVRSQPGQTHPTGTPFLIMEYASGGTLASRGRQPWPVVRGVAADLLRALAHAHARGVVHRDLKPDNILLAEALDPIPRLADFGLATVIDGDANAIDDALGTPRYMAPEQFTGRWRDVGPWTDLYALGILLWELLEGRAPFRGLAVRELAQAHLNEPLPQLTVDAPAGLGAWLEKLTAKPVADRFDHAHDALLSLRALDSAPGRPIPPHMAGRLAAGVTPDETVPVIEPINTGLAPGYPSIAEPLTGPTDTPAPSGLQTRSQLGGLGLLGLRAVPLFGRAKHQRRLERELDLMLKDRRARALVLSGNAGVGKSRLARWVSEDAAERGVARAIIATHGPTTSPDSGLEPALEALFGTTGLTRDLALERLAEHSFFDLSARTARALASAFHEARGQSASPHPAAARERRAALRDTLAAIAVSRPLVVTIDDAQWAQDAIELVSETLGADTPILFILTVQLEALTRDSQCTAELERLLESRHAAEVPVKPLERDAVESFLADQVELSSSVLREVSHRCAGNPLFAGQLLEDWVSRGLLERTRHGFQLVENAELSLPVSLFQLWRSRLDEALIGTELRHRHALFVAAALGRSVRRAELERVCARMGIEWPEAMLQSLYEQSLAEPTPDGFTFVHNMLRETLEELSNETGSAKQLHAIAADVLGELLDDRAPASAWERLANHQTRAGLTERAVESLARAARLRAVGGYPDRAFVLCDRALELIDGSNGDRQSEVLAARATAHYYRGEKAEAQEDADHALQNASLATNIVRALRILALVALSEGRGPDVWPLLERARREAEEAGSIEPLLRTELDMLEASALIVTGSSAQAEPLLARAIARAPNERSFHALRMMLLRVEALQQLGRIEEARDYALESLRCLNGTVFDGLHMQAHNNLGDLFQRLGESASAVGHYEAALEYCAPDTMPTRYVWFNVGLLALREGRDAEALRRFEQALEGLADTYRGRLWLFASLGRLAVMARAGQVAESLALLDQVEPLARESGLKDAEFSELLEYAAESIQTLSDRALKLAGLLRPEV